MDIITNPTNYINKLLSSYDIDTIQYTFNTSVVILNRLIELDHILDKLYYSVNAGMYNDALKYANICRSSFDVYKDELDKYYINKLHKKYVSIIISIKNKLLSEFNIEKEDKINNYLKQASDLLELLNENERIKFLQELSDKICINIPNLTFENNYKSIFSWIFLIIEDNKYTSLTKWNFNKYIIESFCNNIRDIIINQPIDNINLKILIYAKEIENKLINYYLESNDLLTISFDIYCNHKIKELLNKEYNFNTNLNYNDIFESFIELIMYLNNIHNNLKHYINQRNNNIIANFFSKQFNIFLEQFINYFKNNYNINQIIYLSVLKNSIEYLNNQSILLIKLYPTFQLNILETHIYTLNNYIYNLHSNEIKLLLNNSMEVYLTNIIKTIMNLGKNNNNSNIDISKSIYGISNILINISNYDTKILNYLLIDINNFYNQIIDINNLSNISSHNIFNQITMDLYYIKESINNKNNIFDNVENKTKFLSGLVINDNIFIELFKSYYLDHNLDMLKKILKFKNVGDKQYNNIISLYC